MRYDTIPIDFLGLPSWFNAIRHRPKEFMEILKASIIELGIIVPLIVCQLPSGLLVILDGISRYLCAKELSIKYVPCIIHEVEEEDSLANFKKAVKINYAQGRLGIISHLKIVKYLIDRGHTIEEACIFVGRSEKWFFKYRELLTLSKEAQDLVELGKVPALIALEEKENILKYRTLLGRGVIPVLRPREKRESKKALNCAICGKSIRAEERKWYSMHTWCFELLNTVLEDFVHISREKDKILFVCKKHGGIIAEAKFLCGKLYLRTELKEYDKEKEDET